jgi:hypothetical protein
LPESPTGLSTDRAERYCGWYVRRVTSVNCGHTDAARLAAYQGLRDSQPPIPCVRPLSPLFVPLLLGPRAAFGVFDSGDPDVPGQPVTGRRARVTGGSGSTGGKSNGYTADLRGLGEYGMAPSAVVRLAPTQ